MFRIGQKVVCINNSMYGGRRRRGVDYPDVGGVYTVAAAWTNKDGVPLLQLYELKQSKRYRK
jgi:hypothetical protein